tara:strand:+ start:34814 stop:35665 length:852 start_codon:yes stop_codon:yes gene_type:complete
MTNTEMYGNVRQIISDLTGIQIGSDKEYLIPARLSGLLSKYRISSFDDLARSAQENAIPGLKDDFIEQVSTHETTFFRDESTFTAISAQILPEWILRNEHERPKLRIWSMACSTGQEPYSLAMLIHRKHPALFENMEILATDVSRLSVQHASAGLYNSYSVGRGLPEEYLSRYFRKAGDNHQVSEEIRRVIKFDTLNLLAEGYPGGWDIVLCRNVLFYFDMPLRKKILERIRQALSPDGVLILGSAESVDGFLDQYIIRECGLARYYEIKSSRVTFPATKKEK